MKRAALLTMFAAVVLLACVSPGFAQSDDALLKAYTTVKPLVGIDNATVLGQVAAGTTLQMFSYTTTASRDGQTYTGMMVGQDPSSGLATAIDAVVVPLSITIDGSTFDPTAVDPCAADGTHTTLDLVQSSCKARLYLGITTTP